MNILGYETGEKIYEGVKSSIYRAVKGEHKAVIKILNGEYPSTDDISRLKREADILKLFDSPFISKVYAVEKYKNSLLLAEEDISGFSLNRYKGAVSLGKFLDIAIKCVTALNEVHKKNVIHKDIKPHNIVYNESTGRLQIIDFGSASLLSRENPVLINTGVLEGTLSYISPEQTGRMNRNIDYRTDFYSLGAAFYQLLTGSVPFTSSDSIELIHCHIAVLPVPPADRNREIPHTISEIVIKLLSKTPEERYQSCTGLLMDLEECRRQFMVSGKIESFSVGLYDYSRKFQIPEKLYGRESEVKALLHSFERVQINQKSEMILIAGSSGLGKSALIQEIYKPITKSKGYFVLGKFDQFRKDLPYNAFIQAFTELIRQILTETEESVQGWKEKIRTALGPNSGVLTELLSELEILIGRQPAVPELPSTEAQNRFNSTLVNFVKVFAVSEHPLAVFLDDVQWADSASLKLIKLLYSDSSIQNLFFICSYRDNEVDSVHPFSMMLDEIKKDNLAFDLLRLSPLRIEHVNQLIVDTLFCTLQDSEELANVVHAKTGGNPFFVTELLKALYSESLISPPSQGEKVWKWDMQKIRTVNISDNVVEMMADKIQKLSVTAISIMKLAACIGARFYLDSLSVVCSKTESEVIDDLKEAINEGMILIGGISAKFAHDRVREATYSLISSEEKIEYHYKIGKILLENTSPELLDDRIFGILGQLNLGKNLAVNEEEKNYLVSLNLKAGRKAKASAAYDGALNFLRNGAELLKPESWNENYSLTLDLYTELAECEYLAGHFEEADELYEIILSNAKELLDKMPILFIQLRQKTTQLKTAEAFQIGFSVLRDLGLRMPDPDNPEEAQGAFLAQLEEYKILLGSRQVSDLINLPKMSDNRMKYAIEMVTNLGDVAIVQRQDLLGLMSILGVNLSLRYGNTAVSPISYVMWGVINCLGFKDYKSGYEFGQLSLNLNRERFPDSLILGRILAFYTWNINHWQKNIKEDHPLAKDGLEITLNNSDLVYASYFAPNPMLVSFFRGEPLDDVIENGKKNNIFAEKYRQVLSSILGNSTLMTALALQGKTENPYSFNSAEYGFNEEIFIQNFSPYGQPMVYFYLRKFQLFCLYWKFNEANSILPELEKYFPNMPAHIAYSDFFFFRTFMLLGISEKNLSEEERKIRQDKLEEGFSLFKMWSENCEDNFLHKYLLLNAEKMRLAGEDLAAMDLYDKAAESAAKYEYTNDLAFISEAAAFYYISKGKSKLAQPYISDAHYFYGKWGASAKQTDLEQKYPEIMKGSIIKRTVFSSTFSMDSATKLVQTTAGTSFLDLNTVVKASQAISGEIQLGRLLERMMKILFENAGAEKGSFIVRDKEKWTVQAEGNSRGKIEVLQAKPVDALAKDAENNKLDFSPNIVNYVIRTKSIVLLHDASRTGMFTNDAYVKDKLPKSVLCYPIVNQGNLVGVVYLENNLTSNAFTPDRVEILKILSSQIAVSVENSLLYANLEEKVKERTRDLNNALTEVSALKVQQDGDYFLNTLLIEPLGQNNASSRTVTVEFFLRQKKQFTFRKDVYELGGDINISDNIKLNNTSYIVFLNGDAMGKSIQGAGGVLVLGTVFKSILQRTNDMESIRRMYPERWIKNAFVEMHKVFESFEGTMLMSLVFGLIDENTGTVYYINAEHPDPVLYRDSRAEFIPNPAGVFRKLGTQGKQDSRLQISVFRLLPQDKVIIGSDGRDDFVVSRDEVTGQDVINQDENLFLRSVEAGQGSLEKIYNEVISHGQQFDDFSLLSIKYQGAGIQSSYETDTARIKELISADNYIGASSEVELLIRKFPEYTEVFLLGAKIYLSLKNFNSAVDLAERARLRDIKNLQAYEILLDSYTALGRNDRVKELAQSVRLFFPDDEKFQKFLEIK